MQNKSAVGAYFETNVKYFIPDLTEFLERILMPSAKKQACKQLEKTDILFFQKTLKKVIRTISRKMKMNTNSTNKLFNCIKIFANCLRTSCEFDVENCSY